MEREARWLAPLLNIPALVLDGDDLTPEGYQDIRKILTAGREDLGLLRRAVEQPDAALFGLLQERINKYKLIDAHYQHVDGTSVSVAIASSIVAQMLEANPRLTPAGVKAILMTTAEPLVGVPVERQGAGILSATSALKGVRKGF